MLQDRNALQATKWLLKTLSPYGSVESIPQDHVSWQGILQSADQGLVLPRLALALQDRSEQLPSEVHEYLELSLELNRLRNQQLRSQLLNLLRSLNDRGVIPVVMKGATFLLDDSIDLGTRVMFDMDLWTPNEGDLNRTICCLKELGYEMRGELVDFAKCQHLPPFFLDGSLSRIELHHRMINPDYAALVDEEQAVAGLTDRQFEDVRYQSLDTMTALRLSYVQCRWSCEDGHVTIMKWLDFLDRLKSVHFAELTGPWEFGIRSNGDATDERFFTGLSQYCSLPYRGRIDTQLIRAWETAQSDPTWRRFSRNVLGNALDPQKWRQKTPIEIWNALAFRIKNLGNSYVAAKNRNRF